MPCGLVQALRHSEIARRNPQADKPRLRDASSASRRPGSVEGEQAGGKKHVVGEGTAPERGALGVRVCTPGSNPRKPGSPHRARTHVRSLLG